MATNWQKYTQSETWLTGSLRLLSLVSQTETAAVFRAEQQVAIGIGQASTWEVAVKLIPVSKEDEAGTKERLTALKRSVSLSHPNLITCLEADQASVDDELSVLYVAMERADDTLANRTKTRQLSNEEALSLLRNLGEGLQYLHGSPHRRVHGNLKPSNVLLVGDTWKLAEPVNTSTSDLGHKYRAPETSHGPAVPKSDVWSLGAVVLEALQPPSRAVNTEGQLPDTTIAADLPNAFATILRGCLVRDPNLRWSASQVVQAADAANVRAAEQTGSRVDGVATAAPPPGTSPVQTPFQAAPPSGAETPTGSADQGQTATPPPNTAAPASAPVSPESTSPGASISQSAVSATAPVGARSPVVAKGAVWIGLSAIVALLLFAAARNYPRAVPIAPAGSAPQVSSTGDLEEGLRLLQKGDTNGAIARFEATLHGGRPDVWVLANLCGAYAQAGRHVDATSTCEKALAADPTNWLAHYNLACAYALQHRTDDALNALRNALHTLEMDTTARLKKSDLLDQMRDDTMLLSLRDQTGFAELFR